MIIPEQQFSWSRIDLFRFSAATGNAHRIHYDAEFARAEGLQSVVVHTTLHALMLWQTLTNVVDEGSVVSFEWRNHAPLHDEQPVVVGGQADRQGDRWNVALTEVRLSDSKVVCSGQAVVDGSS